MKRRDVTWATVGIVVVCLIMAFTSGCKDKEVEATIIEIVDGPGPIIIGGDEGTPCDQESPCGVEHDNGDITVITCKVHEPEPEPLVFDEGDVVWGGILIDSSAPTLTFDNGTAGIDWEEVEKNADSFHRAYQRLKNEDFAKEAGLAYDATTDSFIDPNDPLFSIITVADWDCPNSLTICTDSGGDLELSFEGDELKITGDADMNEAAQIFFNEVLKEIADGYIRSRLQ